MEKADSFGYRWYADGVVTTLAASFYAPHVLRFNRIIVKNESVTFLQLFYILPLKFVFFFHPHFL
jgi:hypothetical protein